MYHNSKTGETREPLPYKDGNPICHDPLYVAGVLGNICYDEGDRDTCDPGFVDRGFGCEREESEESLFEEISGISGMTISPTPQLRTSVELNNTISDLLRLLLTQEVSEVDRLLIISELEQVIQSLLTDQTINVEFDIEDNGNEKVITITTTSTLPGIVEEEPIEEEQEESNDSGNGDDNGNDDPPSEEPPQEPDPPEPDPPVELPPAAPPFG